MPFADTERLGIKIRIDGKFKNVVHGKYVALIWERNAYRWITFDDIQKLTLNLSEPYVKRADVIDDRNAELLVENGDFFRVYEPIAALQNYAKFLVTHQKLMEKYVEPIRKLQESGKRLNTILNPPALKLLNQRMNEISKIASVTRPLVAVENLSSIRDNVDNLKNIMVTGKEEIKDIKIDEKELEDVTKTAKSLEKDLENSVDYDQASEHLSDYSVACSDAQASSQIMMEIATEIENSEKNDAKGNESILKKIWDKIRGSWEILKQKISDIIDRIGGSVTGLGVTIKESLEELKNALGKGIETIAKAFKKVGENLFNLISKLLKQMFQFLNTFTRLAKENGWGVKEVEVKLPSIKLKMVNLVVFSVPLPTIDPPDVTITFQPIS